jgi:hypothetical protein
MASATEKTTFATKISIFLVEEVIFLAEGAGKAGGIVANSMEKVVKLIEKALMPRLAERLVSNSPNSMKHPSADTKKPPYKENKCQNRHAVTEPIHTPHSRCIRRHNSRAIRSVNGQPISAN